MEALRKASRSALLVATRGSRRAYQNYQLDGKRSFSSVSSTLKSTNGKFKLHNIYTPQVTHFTQARYYSEEAKQDPSRQQQSRPKQNVGGPKKEDDDIPFDLKEDFSQADPLNQYLHTNKPMSTGAMIFVAAVLAVSAVLWTWLNKVTTLGEADDASPIPDFAVSALKMFPTRIGSRAWGWLTNLEVPTWLRGAVYGAYGTMFNVVWDEVEKPLVEYKSLADFFTRNLVIGARPLDNNDMVCPVDGKVLHFGEVVNDQWMEQVKGIKYTMEQFMGSDAKTAIADIRDRFQEEKKKRKAKPSETDKLAKKTYYMIIYLAPGDYHGVHSPVDWKIEEMRHFPGPLFSVSPIAARLIKGLFAVNERIVLNGTWKHGFFSFTPVGAYNVGSMTLEFDPTVRTNMSGQKALINQYNVDAKRGERLAFFNLGSTVVLIWDSPEVIFRVDRMQKVKLGQTLVEYATKEMIEHVTLEQTLLWEYHKEKDLAELAKLNKTVRRWLPGEAAKQDWDRGLAKAKQVRGDFSRQLEEDERDELKRALQKRE